MYKAGAIGYKAGHGNQPVTHVHMRQETLESGEIQYYGFLHFRNVHEATSCLELDGTRLRAYPHIRLRVYSSRPLFVSDTGFSNCILVLVYDAPSCLLVSLFLPGPSCPVFGLIIPRRIRSSEPLLCTNVPS
jgi:hypothetical protein